ncbi:MAG: hypothetical protein ABSA48_03105 [Terracidiphilus sp.]|jgi:hypothetical protein
MELDSFVMDVFADTPLTGDPLAGDIFLCATIESSRVADARGSGSTVVVAKGRFFLP